MPKVIVRNQFLSIILLLLVVYFVLANTIGAASLIALENCLMLSVGVLIAIIYGPLASRISCRKHPDSSDLLALGVWLTWLSISLGRVVSLVVRSFNIDVSIYDTHLITFQVYLGIVGGGCQIVAPVMGTGKTHRGWWYIALVISTALAMLTTLSLIHDTSTISYLFLPLWAR